MSFWQFVFSFLFVRNWHSGKRELSQPRVDIFFAGIFLVLLSLTIVSFLQNSTVYVP